MAYSINKKEVIQYQPDQLRMFRLYSYEWIDNLNFTFNPREFLSNADEYVEVVKELFKKAGWYGDGEIEVIWVPPFMVSEYGFGEMAFGLVVWHVKQESDGISWLLSPQRLPLLDVSHL